MTIKRISAFVLAIVIAASLSACTFTSDSTSEPTSEPMPEPIYVAGRQVSAFVTAETGLSLSEDGTLATYDLTTSSDYVQNVRFLGRTYATDYRMFSNSSVTHNGVTCFNWTDSGFEITFTGTEISAELISNRYDTEPIYLYVAVDGADEPEECNYIALRDNEIATYTLASGLADGDHIITVRRSTRGCMGNFLDQRSLAGVSAIKSVTIKGTTPALMGKVYDRALRLEFIGDSITCGDSIYKSLDINNKTVNIEDGYRTYAASCARALDADYNVMAISGNGFICSLFGTELLDLPDQYLYTCSLSLGSSNDVKWDFSQYQADVVIVNLGTNDSAGYLKNYSKEDIKYGVTKSVAGGEVKRHTGVWDFLDMIHENNPDAKILWVCGAMGIRLSAIINEAVTEWNTAHNTDIAYFYQMTDCNSVSNGKAYDNSHPSENYGKIYGAEMAQFITDTMGVKPISTETLEAE